ncbi:class I SAM-dependent methyltransferase [bacterium]
MIKNIKRIARIENKFSKIKKIFTSNNSFYENIITLANKLSSKMEESDNVFTVPINSGGKEKEYLMKFDIKRETKSNSDDIEDEFYAQILADVKIRNNMIFTLATDEYKTESIYFASKNDKSVKLIITSKNQSKLLVKNIRAEELNYSEKTEIDEDFYDMNYYLTGKASRGTGFQNTLFHDVFSDIVQRSVKSVDIEKAEYDKYSFFDVGCSFGASTFFAKKLGFKAYGGCDFSKFSIEYGAERVKNSNLFYYDLSEKGLLEKAGQKYDFLLCYDVLEHMYNEDAHTAIDNIFSICDNSLFLNVGGPYYTMCSNMDLVKQYRFAKKKNCKDYRTHDELINLNLNQGHINLLPYYEWLKILEEKAAQHGFYRNHEAERKFSIINNYQLLAFYFIFSKKESESFTNLENDKYISLFKDRLETSFNLDAIYWHISNMKHLKNILFKSSDSKISHLEFCQSIGTTVLDGIIHGFDSYGIESDFEYPHYFVRDRMINIADSAVANDKAVDLITYSILSGGSPYLNYINASAFTLNNVSAFNELLKKDLMKLNNSKSKYILFQIPFLGFDCHADELQLDVIDIIEKNLSNFKRDYLKEQQFITSATYSHTFHGNYLIFKMQK